MNTDKDTVGRAFGLHLPVKRRTEGEGTGKDEKDPVSRIQATRQKISIDPVEQPTLPALRHARGSRRPEDWDRTDRYRITKRQKDWILWGDYDLEQSAAAWFPAGHLMASPAPEANATTTSDKMLSKRHRNRFEFFGHGCVTCVHYRRVPN